MQAEVQTQPNLERLEALVDLILVPLLQTPLKFNLKEWVLGACGTAKCAIGHAASHPYFMEQGLVLQKTTYGIYYPVYGGWDNFHAAARFFGISRQQAEYLFAPYEYSGGTLTTVQEVIDRVQGFIGDHK